MVCSSYEHNMQLNFAAYNTRQFGSGGSQLFGRAVYSLHRLQCVQLVHRLQALRTYMCIQYKAPHISPETTLSYNVKSNIIYKKQDPMYHWYSAHLRHTALDAGTDVLVHLNCQWLEHVSGHQPYTKCNTKKLHTHKCMDRTVYQKTMCNVYYRSHITVLQYNSTVHSLLQ